MGHEFKAASIATEIATLREQQPRPLAKLYGQRGPTPEQLAAWQAKMREYNSKMAKLKKAHRSALEADNAAFRAGARDVQPVGDAPDKEDDIWKIDTDKGAAQLVKRDGKTMTAAEIVRKYGFSLAFVKEVLGGDNQRPGRPAGDVALVGDLGVEYVLYGTKKGDASWKEQMLLSDASDPARVAKVKALATKDGFEKFRVAKINLANKPNFGKTLA